jgi:hypothetical protein
VNKALKTRLEIPKSMALMIKNKIMAISDSCGILMECIVVNRNLLAQSTPGAEKEESLSLPTLTESGDHLLL